MRFIAKLFLPIFIVTVTSFGACYAETAATDNVVELNYQFGVEAASKNLTVIVYAPQKSIDNLAGLEGNFKDTVVFAKQVKTDDEKDRHSRLRLRPDGFGLHASDANPDRDD